MPRGLACWELKAAEQSVCASRQDSSLQHGRSTGASLAPLLAKGSKWARLLQVLLDVQFVRTISSASAQAGKAGEGGPADTDVCAVAPTEKR